MIEPGTKVTYVPEHGEPERGIIKSIPDEDPVKSVFVVYHVGNEDWDNYDNYTAASTKVTDLVKGWPPDPNLHFDFHLHANKEENYNFFTELLTRNEGDMDEDKAREYIKTHSLQGTGYEVEFTCILTPEGKALATHVNGVKLEKPTEI